MTQSRRRIKRACAACGARQPGKYGIPDPCLGTLPNVENACCGHGSMAHCYVVVIKRDGSGTYSYRGTRARNKLIKLGGNPAEFVTASHYLEDGVDAGWKPIG